VHGLDPGILGFEFPATRGAAGIAIREGRATVSREYGELADPVPNEAYEGFTDALVAPMRWSDDVQGVLGVGRRGAQPFGRRDANVLEAFAGLASLALRNAETFTHSSRQARVQRGFYRIASILGQSLSRAATLEAVAQAAAEALGGAAAAVLVPQGRRLALAGRYELADRFAELLETGVDEGGGPLARAAARRACSRRRPSPTTSACPRRGATRRARTATARSSPCRSRYRDTKKAGSSPSSSPRSASSATTTSSSRAISPTRRGAHSSAASSSRRSGTRARSRSS
jgi:hypothetical protein